MATHELDILRLQDLAVGDEWLSPRRTVTEADVVGFAGLSGDFNPIHVDHQFARSTVFRKPVAHGLLGMAIGSGLATHSPRVDTLALLEIVEWRFLEPIYFGDTVYVKTRIAAIDPGLRGRRGVVTWHRQLYNQHDKVVQEGITRTMVRGNSADARADAHQHDPQPS